MSRERRTTAVLNGFGQPYFADTVDALTDALGTGHGPDWLCLVASAVSGYTKSHVVPLTEDDYWWYLGLCFNRNGGQVVLLIPWSLDYGVRGGTKADRAIAAYTLGVSTAEAGKVVRELTAAALQQRQFERRAEDVGFDSYRADRHLRARSGWLDQLLAVHVDGRPEDTKHGHVAGRNLAVHMRERLAWPSAVNMPTDFSLVVYRTPVDEYVSLSTALANLGSGQSATLGSHSTFLASGGRYVEFELEPDMFYDLMVVGHYADGSFKIVGWVRYSTADAELKVPTEITLDEAKLAATLAIGLDRKAGDFFTADLDRMCGWGDSRDYQIVGFDFGRPRDGSDKHFGVLVNQYGYAQIYCDLTPQDVWEHLGP